MKVTILIGASGSGKSTWANQQPEPKVSADHFFMVGGEYRFDPTQLCQAHAASMRNYIDLLRSGSSVIVDNTNTTLVEIAPYIAVAYAFSATIEVLYFTGTYRNEHGVPDQVVDAMRNRIKSMLQTWPPYWPDLATVPARSGSKIV
jgi:predicted kinase